MSVGFLPTGLACAQATYTELTEKATETVASQDSANYPTALQRFEEAFAAFPDSVNGTELYFASKAAAALKYNDQAFAYLTPLANMETDEEGYPGWSFVLDEYAKEDYQNLLDDPRWSQLEEEVAGDKQAYFERLSAAEEEFFDTAGSALDTTARAEALYPALRSYHPYLKKRQQDYSLSFTINDSATSSYLVHLPSDYTPDKPYPVLVFLHGAVRYSSLREYQIDRITLGGGNRFYTQYAALHDVILVFPGASKKYNWMTSDDGFFMVPNIIKQLKTTLNLDDNKIFVTGHSNGATGSFSYLMKQPTPFAGFYGFNTHPKVYTGGTFVENILNRSFINFSTDQDYYYPPQANDRLALLMDSVHADYEDHRYNGFPHWFPQFDESEPAFEILFADLAKRERNPYPAAVQWEFDDNRYGTVDWLTAITLDTLAPKADWHQPLNFAIEEWLAYDENDSLVTEQVEENAFDFPRKSGKIIAAYQDNTFRVKTSRIGSFRVNISPEMINLNANVKVYVNGKLRYDQQVGYDRAFMLRHFRENRDREQVWVNTIELEVKDPADHDG